MQESLTEIHVVLDRSGSMRSLQADMQGGFDAFVEKQRKEPGECRMSLYQFDDRYETVYEDKLLFEVPKLELTPRGMTALYDSIGRTITSVRERHSKMAEYSKPGRVIFIVITDGANNASHEYTQRACRDLVKACEADKWQVLFLGADLDVTDEGQNLGINVQRSSGKRMTSDNTRSYVSNVVSSAVSNYRNVDMKSSAYEEGIVLNQDEESDA